MRVLPEITASLGTRPVCEVINRHLVDDGVDSYRAAEDTTINRVLPGAFPD